VIPSSAAADEMRGPPSADPLSEPDRPARVPRVYTRNFRSRQTLSLVLATWLTMLGVGLVSSIGLVPLIGVPLLLLYVTGVICILAGHDVITLTADGFHREWTPLAARVLPLKTHTTSIPFAAVRSYKVDSEMSRGLVTYDYLEIDLAQDPHRLIATSRHDRAGFEAFKAAFLARVGATRAGGTVSDTQAPLSTTPACAGVVESGACVSDTVPPAPIRERRSFYASPFAILLALLFGAVSIVLVGAAFTGHLSFGSLVRLMLVILPGTGYILWRVARAR
jgi:hypothetical protein